MPIWQPRRIVNKFTNLRRLRQPFSKRMYTNRFRRAQHVLAAFGAHFAVAQVASSMNRRVISLQADCFIMEEQPIRVFYIHS